MTKHKISQFQMNNLHAALEAWKTMVPKDTVDLRSFRQEYTPEACADKPTCGSPGCFGGWLPHMAHFQQLGVVSGFNGVPLMDDGVLTSTQTSGTLFGWYLFSGSCDITPMKLDEEGMWCTFMQKFSPILVSESNYDHIIRRLNYAILNSEVDPSLG